jgi:hypothetical protein
VERHNRDVGIDRLFQTILGARHTLATRSYQKFQHRDIWAASATIAVSDSGNGAIAAQVFGPPTGRFYFCARPQMVGVPGSIGEWDPFQVFSSAMGELPGVRRLFKFPFLKFKNLLLRLLGEGYLRRSAPPTDFSLVQLEHKDFAPTD